MTNNPNHHPSVLALFPTTEGYAFTFFERANRLVEWRSVELPGKADKRNEKALLGIERLIENCAPDLIAIEDYNEEDSKRADRIRRLYGKIEKVAEKRGIEIDVIPREDVFATFAEVQAQTRYEVARRVAQLVPALSFRLPPERKFYDSERSIMGVFAAAALAITFYRGQGVM